MSLSRADIESLYADNEKNIFNVIYRLLWDEAEAMDVVQEAFVKLWRARARIEPARARPLAFRAAINLARNRRRARAVWRWVSLEPLRAKEAPAAPHREAKLRAAVESLPPPLREVIVLCELSELTYAEAAVALGIPEGTVGSRRHKALGLLRAALSVEARDGERAVP
jgi:RNA polymerase sigma-70 factor (ECF subfamily)